MEETPRATLPHNLLTGDTLFAGRASGTILVVELDTVDELAHSPTPHKTRDADRDRETAAFQAALSETEGEVTRYIEDPAGIYRDVAEPVFRPQLLMLQDEAFTGEMRRQIEAGASAERAITEVALHFEQRFEAIDVPSIREKADDVRDLKLRLLTHLPNRSTETLAAHGRIALIRRPLPSTLIRLAIDGVAGLVLTGENLTAHVAILAGSLGVPAVLVAGEAVAEITDGIAAEIEDGTVRMGVKARRPEPPSPLPAPEYSTAAPDSLVRSVRVMANVNLLRDASAAAAVADGIGLYRSEFPFIIHQGFPSEEVQYRVYRDIAGYFPSSPVTFRTADIGGDKLIGAEHESDANPFLGVRGIRFSLANKSMFRSQLRAMLRAGAGRDLKIMFPMVSTLDEVEQARAEVQAAIHELVREGAAVNRAPKIGAMVEIPSAVIAVDELAASLDFLSIGTNDLIMYMLAVDRTNSRVAGLYRTHHPIILRTLNYIVEHAGDAAEVSVCGAAAADPTMIPFLLGIGIRELSVPPERIAAVRKQIAGLTREDCAESAARMLAIRSWPEMERYLACKREGV